MMLTWAHLECISSADRPRRRRNGDLAATAVVTPLVVGARDLQTSPWNHWMNKSQLTLIIKCSSHLMLCHLLSQAPMTCKETLWEVWVTSFHFYAKFYYLSWLGIKEYLPGHSPLGQKEIQNSLEKKSIINPPWIENVAPTLRRTEFVPIKV